MVYNTRKTTTSQAQAQEDISTQNSFQVLADTNQDMDLPFQALLDSLAQGDKIKPQDLGQVLSSVLSQQKELSRLKVENDTLQDENGLLKKTIQVHEGRIDHLEKDAGKLLDRIVDLQCRTMANNVIIGKHPEDEDEDTEALVHTFLRRKLGIRQVLDISIAHRYGRKGTQPRPIVVAFVRRSDKQLVLSKGKALKGFDEWISEQRPDELRTDQALLFKQKNAILDQNPALKEKVHVIGTKLVVDGVEKVDMRKVKNTSLDRKFNTTTEALNMRPTSGTLTTVDNSVYRAHYVPLDCPGKRKAALASIYAQDGAGKATHNSWAMLVDGQEGVDDDGELGAAREILAVMHARGVENAMIVVSRWFGGRHIYNKRFETIKKLTEDVLDLV